MYVCVSVCVCVAGTPKEGYCFRICSHFRIDKNLHVPTPHKNPDQGTSSCELHLCVLWVMVSSRVLFIKRRQDPEKSQQGKAEGSTEGT